MAKKKASKKVVQKKTTAKQSERSANQSPGKFKMMSVIMKEMIGQILVEDNASEEARAVALFLANIAWNRAVGISEQKGFVKKQIAEMKPASRNFWQSFVDKNDDKLIGILVKYKYQHYPNDDRYVAGVSIAEDARYKEGGHIRVAYIPKEQWEEYFSLPPMIQTSLVQSRLGVSPD